MYTHEHIIDGLITKAIKTWNIFEPHDRALIGLSGGKDSTVLAYFLAAMVKHGRLPITLHALHIVNDFSSVMSNKQTNSSQTNSQTTTGGLSPVLKELVQSWGITVTELYVPIVGRLKADRTLNCYWCSMQRRTELIKFAETHGYNTIALGHHLDDVLETVLMNMLEKGELSTMIPRMLYKKYPIKLVRPLYLVEEHQIKLFAKELGLYNDNGITVCTCSFNIGGKRDKTGKLLEQLTGGSSKKKHLLLNSLMNINGEYLPKV
ncbi:MAG TPA: tRNA 2-thiocytidine biosynthesis TtcA family protein [Spirochaetales bacterium]|nr:tRNA 2-thiocytidine biosynthesis TtcA family protein [Spirochaetales bacterium]HQK34200.1 tRNA 2-thiocytidine biosynthesis TtcA family protein [Spirochaetales bacterium]HRV29765.1 tRNA 2-thiocytidine biosynthesis TtcA family protein [Spirochaetia bacterium]